MSVTTSYELSDQQLRFVQSLVYRLSGIHLHDGKRQLVEHRLARRLRDRGLTGYAAYIELLKQPGETLELQRCLNALTTNETFFFRHTQHWDFIGATLLPAWRSRQRGPRTWSAACSTGEEPYSLAILLSELLPSHAPVIEATDINDTVLTAAKAGRYGAYAMQKVTPLCRERHFTRTATDPEQWTISAAMRAMVTFRHGNLQQASRGIAFDLVLLRNVLIYFDEPSKLRALQLIESRLAPDGWLMIGGAESLGSRAANFSYIGPGIYRKKSHA